MTKDLSDDYLWYVAYGSNLCEERFMCYIRGGKTATCLRESRGCSDPAPPLKSKATLIPHQLYFAKEGMVWGKGAASFITASHSEDFQAYGRQYLIKKDQFIDIVLQENNVKLENIEIDYLHVIRAGEAHLGDPENMSWYGRILYLDDDEGYPRFTFTAKWDDFSQPYRHPSERYLKMIIRGLRESHELSDESIMRYLKQTPGIEGRISQDDLYDFLK